MKLIEYLNPAAHEEVSKADRNASEKQLDFEIAYGYR
jgi:hypothetical protein